MTFATCYICNEFIHRFVPSALSKIRVTDEIKNISKLDLTPSVDGSALILNWTGRQFFKSPIANSQCNTSRRRAGSYSLVAIERPNSVF